MGIVPRTYRALSQPQRDFSSFADAAAAPVKEWVPSTTPQSRVSRSRVSVMQSLSWLMRGGAIGNASATTAVFGSVSQLGTYRGFALKKDYTKFYFTSVVDGILHAMLRLS